MDDDNSRTDCQYESVDLDDLLPSIGEFGKYQKLMLWLVCLPACIPCGFGAFNQLFMSETPDHWCNIPILRNLTVKQRKHLGIPKTNDTYRKCEEYAIEWETEMSENNWTLVTVNESWPIRKCSSGWEYDKSEISSSIVIDFDLVCDKDIYPTLGLVALNIGGPVGVYSFGLLNDRIGRRKTFFLCLTTLLFGGILTAISLNFWWWAVSRIIVGLTIPAMYQIPFIIALELVGPNYRSFVTVMTCMFYTLGLMLLSGVTYLVRDWIKLSYVTSLPFILYYIYWFFLPESPRWLLARGRYTEAVEILRKLAQLNGKTLPENFCAKLANNTFLKRSVSGGNQSNQTQGLMSLCRTPNIRLKTCLITLNWFANETVYVGLSYYGPSLGSNQYISFLLSCVVEIPSYIACWLVMDKWGRRWPLCLCMIISGFSCIATVLIPPEDSVNTLVLFLISKSAISASFLIIYPFAGELYPTQLRGIGIGASAYIGGLGLIIIPFITYLGSEMLILPLIVMGFVSIIGGLSGLRLPETLHHRLPQTVEEGEEFGKDFSLRDCCRCIPLKPESSTACSYEDLEMQTVKVVNEETALENKSRRSISRLVRQSSTMDTQKDSDGTMKITYWF